MKSGFTLVELMVSLAVIMLLAGIGTVSISNFSDSKKVEGATGELVDQIKLARNMAITGQMPNGGVGLAYVGVKVANDGTVTAMVKSTGPNYFVKKIDSMSGLTVNAATFGFAGSTGRLTDFSGVFIPGPLNLTVTGTSGSKTITISDLGIINEN
jgi:prepilin-type N-terminal cleavage/methylation domain-containing protein